MSHQKNTKAKTTAQKESSSEEESSSSDDEEDSEDEKPAKTPKKNDTDVEMADADMNSYVKEPIQPKSLSC